MAKHRTYSTEFKRQVSQEYIAGETLHALAKRHDVSRNLIRIWIAKYEAGAFEDDFHAADLLQEYEAGCQSKHCSDCLGVPEAGWHIDRDAIGQRDHRADTRDRHQAPADIIVPDDSQQAAMQDTELLANYPPDKEQRFHQHGQIGKVFDKLPDARLELGRPHYAHLETEVAQGGTHVVLNGDGL